MIESLPAGVTLASVAAVLIPVAIVTLALRALPFVFISKLKDNHVVRALGIGMPVGVMTVLVIYALKGQTSSPGGLPAALLAAAITVGLHLWKRDSGLSIFGGTAAYMLLVNLVFS